MDNLTAPVALHATAAPGSLALSVAGTALSYAEFARLGRAIAAWLGPARRVGVWAGRGLGAYAGVLGAFWAGATYVPLGLNWPEERLLATLRQTGLDALILDAAALPLLTPALRAACPAAMLLTEGADPRCTALAELAESDMAPVPVAADHIAYILFTSGTTGTPKGVEIPQRAIAGHLAAIQDVYGFTAADRVSLAFELTFDPSILNMFMAWQAGASLHVVGPRQLMAPIAFIQDHALTVWNSAPTTIGVLMTLGLLEPGALPSLRISIFGGETLTLEAARAWARAAPNSTVDNVYGPTEATIEILHQRLTEPPCVTPERGSLALGLPYPEIRVAILDADRGVLPAGQVGEIAVAGFQLAAGYLGRPDLTAARFPWIAGTRWYLTGDTGYQDSEGRFHRLGRTDDQVKIRGHRVELGDVESHLREICNTELAAAVPWPLANGGATGLVAFVASTAKSPSEIRAALQTRLPAYMVPQSVRQMEALPLTPHGKVDRQALTAMLEK